MTENALKETVIRLAEPVVRSLGLVIWGVEILQAGRMIVRLFVDVPPEAPILKARPTAAGRSLRRFLPIRLLPPLLPPLRLPLTNARKFRATWRWPWKWRTAPQRICVGSLHPRAHADFFQPCANAAVSGGHGGSPSACALAPQDVETAAARDAGRKVWRGRLAAVEEDGFVLEPALVSPEGDAKPEGLPPLCLPCRPCARQAACIFSTDPGKPGKSSGKKTGKAAGKASGKNVAETENTAD